MKKINLRESLLKIDRSTDFKHALTDLYEACMLEEGDKRKLAQFIEDRDIPGMSNLLSNAAGVMMENISDDLPDDEAPLVENDTMSMYRVANLEDIDYIMSYEMPDCIVYGGDVEGEYKCAYHNGVSVNVKFNPDAPGYVYTIDGEGPYETRSSETVKSDITRALDRKGWNEAFPNGSPTDLMTVSGDEPLMEEVNAQSLQSSVYQAATDKLRDMGYDEDFISDYFGVKVTNADNNCVRVTVWGELSYEETSELADILNPIVEKEDPQAYFDHDTSGRMSAYIRNDQSDDIPNEEQVAEWTDKFNNCRTWEELKVVYNEIVDSLNRDDLSGGTYSAVQDVIDRKIDELKPFEESLSEDTGFDDLDEGIFSIAGDATRRGLVDLYKGVRNVSKGVRDVAKAGANDIKKAATDAKQSKFADKVRDTSRAIKNSDSVDDFKADYKRRQDLRKKSDAKRDQVWTDKSGNARIGKSIGNEQDWTYVVNGKKMKYDDYMKIPSNERQRLNNAGRVKRLDLSGRPITKNQNDKRLNASLIRESSPNPTGMNHRDRIKFITLATKGLTGKGYSREEANDIAIKWADGVGTGYDSVEFEVNRRLGRALSKDEYDAEYRSVKEGWTHFEFKSGSNPYIAKDEKEKNRILKKYGDKAREVKPGFYEVDDASDSDELYPVNEAVRPYTGENVGALMKNFADKANQFFKQDGQNYEAKYAKDVHHYNMGADVYHCVDILYSGTMSDCVAELKCGKSVGNRYEEYTIKSLDADGNYGIIASGTFYDNMIDEIEDLCFTFFDGFNFDSVRENKNVVNESKSNVDHHKDKLTKITNNIAIKIINDGWYKDYDDESSLYNEVVDFVQDILHSDNQDNYISNNDYEFIKDETDVAGIRNKNAYGGGKYEFDTDFCNNVANKVLELSRVKNESKSINKIGDTSLTERVGPTHPEESKISDRLMSISGTTKVEFDWSNAEIYSVPENHLIMLVFCHDGFDEPYFENRRKWRASVLGKLRTMGWTLEDPVEDNDSYLYLVMQKRRAVTEDVDNTQGGKTKYKVTWKVINVDDSWFEESKEVLAKDEKSAKATVKDSRARDIKAVKMTEAFKHPQFDGPWWYLCKHGIGPGSLPKDVTVLETVEDETNPYRVYVALDKVLTTSELKQYEMKEARPPKLMRESKNREIDVKEVDYPVIGKRKYIVSYDGKNYTCILCPGQSAMNIVVEGDSNDPNSKIVRDANLAAKIVIACSNEAFGRTEKPNRFRSADGKVGASKKMTESTTNSSKLIHNAITELVKSGSSISDPDFVDDVMDYMEDVFWEHPSYREVLNTIRDFRSKGRTNTLKSVDTSSRNTFQVGDEMTYSGLYGGETTIKVLGVNGSKMKAEISWPSMEDGSDLKDKKVYDIVLDDEGNDCIEVWHYRGETGRVYPPERDRNLKDDLYFSGRVVD